MIEFARKCVTDDQAQDLRDIIDNELYSTYTVADADIKGQAVSFLKTEICGRMRGIGNDFEDLIRALGYNIVEAKNNRGQKCLAVTK